MSQKKQITIERLKKFEPISTLSDERVEELVTLSSIENIPVGMSLFREGDIDNQTIYLMSGDVQLISSDGKIDKVITHKQDIAIYPIDDSQPRQMSCNALGRVEIVRIDNSVLDYMVMWDQLAVSEENEEPKTQEENQEKSTAKVVEKKSDSTNEVLVEENEVEKNKAEKSSDDLDDDADDKPTGYEENKSWIRKMRHIMAFKNMPPANIKALLERMETLLVKEGDIVVKQGEPGQYYYVLTEGTAQVTRMIELANLEAGASFGEEALAAGATRNASVTMSSDGMIMRLSKSDFDELLRDPLLERVSADDALERVNKGAQWLDVRHAKEYSHNRLHKAINMPLHELRIRLPELDKDTHYICYCGTGRRSSAAAFLLAQRGFKVSILNGGIQVMAHDIERMG